MVCVKCSARNDRDARFCSACGSAMQRNEFTFAPPSPAEGAGFWRRFAALLIDSMVLSIGGMLTGGIVGGIIGFILGISGTDLATIQIICGAVGYLIGIVINWLYYTLMESSSKQATLGKMALGIVVSDLSGEKISFGKANGRYWGKLISLITLWVGFIMAGFTEKKQALHDMVAGTLVVKK